MVNDNDIVSRHLRGGEVMCQARPLVPEPAPLHLPLPANRSSHFS